jgi:hypothetical protein
MMTRNHQSSLRFFVFLATGIGMLFFFERCTAKKEEIKQLPSVINTAHLDKLYEEIRMGKDTVGIIHIYSEYPDYHLVGDNDEGMACVDDASRAAIFYLLRYRQTDSLQFFHKGKMLLKFLLAMQADNGYYYNFIWPDGSINKNGSTSKAEPSWWAWRSLWAFGVVNNYLEHEDMQLAQQIKSQQAKLIHNILHEPQYRSVATDTAGGFTIPTWLPKGSGTDQASIIMMGLLIAAAQEQQSPYRDSMVSFIHHMADGIMMMQVHAPDSLEDGAFLSWGNLWHAYGNIQAFALLTVGQELLDSAMIQSAMYEVDHFYPAILKAGGLDHFWLKKNGDHILKYETASFNQIAYGRGPMIWAALQAHALSSDQDKKYLDLACQLAMWFFGENPAKAMMYDPVTGRGFDGINSPTEINRNAGAESTIESLLALQTLEMYKVYYDADHKQFKPIVTTK